MTVVLSNGSGRCKATVVPYTVWLHMLPSPRPLPTPSLQLEEASSRNVRLQSQVESLEEAAKDKEETSRGQQ